MSRIGIASLVLLVQSSAVADSTVGRASLPLIPDVAACARVKDSAEGIKIANGVGIALFSAGYVVGALSSISANSNTERGLAVVPVAGAITGLAMGDAASAWMPALLFSAWSQAAGALLLGVAAHAKRTDIDPACSAD